MSSQLAGAARNASARPASCPHWRACFPAAAGLAYLVTWIAGLAAWPVNLALNATAAQAAAAHAAHPAKAMTQYLLVEGLAGLLLAAVLGSALLPRLRARTSRRATVAASVFGAAAVALSLAQCVLGLVLTGAATGHHITTSGDLFKLVNQLDGAKMLALAVTAASLAAVQSPRPVLPRWLRAPAVLLAAALVASGYAYVTLTNALAWTAFCSGALLLLWVAAVGLALTVRAAPSPKSPSRSTTTSGNGTGPELTG